MRHTIKIPFLLIAILFSTYSSLSYSEESFIPKPPSLNASNYILIDSVSGRVLAEKEADVRIEPASITKIMTGYVAADQISKGFVSLDDEVLFYPTAIGDEIMSTYDSSNAWQTVMQGHAAANIMPVVASNRIGSESVKGQINGFYGKSFICNRSGKIIAEASKDKEEVIIAEIDTEENHLFRRNWGLFRDRRPELYREILSLNGETKD